MPEAGLPPDRDRGRRRRGVHVAVHRLDGGEEGNVVEGDHRHAGRNRGQIPAQPLDLGAVHVAVVPKVIDIHRVEPHEVDPAVIERVVVGPEVAVVHPPPVERVLRGHQREVPLDPEDLVVARHGPHRGREFLPLALEQIVVTGGFGFTDPERVPHQVAGDDHEGRRDRVHDGAEPPGPGQAGRADVGIGSVDEYEIRWRHRRRQGKHEPALGGSRIRLAPERAHRAVPVGDAHEQHPRAQRMGNPEGAVRPGHHHLVLIRYRNAGQPRLADIARAIGVAVHEDRAGEAGLGRHRSRGAQGEERNQRQ